MDSGTLLSSTLILTRCQLLHAAEELVGKWPSGRCQRCHGIGDLHSFSMWPSHILPLLGDVMRSSCKLGAAVVMVSLRVHVNMS